MNPLIKWPGGKSGELGVIAPLIPPFDRYIEPFFGGGALFFHLAPQKAAVNDVSPSLIQFYRLVQAQDPDLRRFLDCYNHSFTCLLRSCRARGPALAALFHCALAGTVTQQELLIEVDELVRDLLRSFDRAFWEELAPSPDGLAAQLRRMAGNKLLRTVDHYRRRPFSSQDLMENLVTGFASGYYMYFRDLFNSFQLGRSTPPSPAYETANFYFIREYCYGSMFRYNRAGEFNIPYGGMSYNKKNFHAKVERLFSPETAALLKNTQLSRADFEVFLKGLHLTAQDFLFLDPPYDTDFSDYEGKDFTPADQRRLAAFLEQTPAQFILVIKNTDFIRGLYADKFHIRGFDKTYTYNVRSRNERRTEHILITNLNIDHGT